MNASRSWSLAVGLLVLSALGTAATVHFRRETSHLQNSTTAARQGLAEMRSQAQKIVDRGGVAELRDEGEIRRLLLFGGGARPVRVSRQVVNLDADSVEVSFRIEFDRLTRRRLLDYLLQIRRQLPAVSLLAIRQVVIESPGGSQSDLWEWTVEVGFQRDGALVGR